MPGVFIWGYDDDNDKWIPALVNADGALEVSMADYLDIIPKTDSTYDIGSATKQFLRLFVDRIILTDGAGNYLQLPKLTTTQRDALTPIEGMMIYNSTTDQVESYSASAWGGNIPRAHKDSHDPENGGDALDTAAPSELASVQAAGAGSSHSLARADHAHQLQHSIANNHLVTIDGTTNQPVSTDYAKFTASGLEGREKSQILTDLNVADGADVTGSNAPQAHKLLHQNDGADEITVAGLAGVLTEDQHVIDAEVQAVSINALSEDTTPSLGGNLDLNEKSIQYELTLDTDGKYEGEYISGVCGETVIYSEVVYLKTADQRWWKAIASAEATGGDVMLGIMLEGGAAAETKKIMLRGFLREDDFNFTSYGQALFLDASTGGDMTATAPAVATNIVRIVGYAGANANVVRFEPSHTWLEIG